MTRYQDWVTEEGCILLRGWKREGRSLEDIAGYVGVQPGTLRGWMAKYDEIRDALSEEGCVTDFQVENALLKRALGYEAIERKVEISAKGERKEVETTKQVAPDMSAISFWLKKRKPEKWGDGGGGERPENNLTELLEEEGGFDGDAIPELQSAAAVDSDVVEEA